MTYLASPSTAEPVVSAGGRWQRARAREQLTRRHRTAVSITLSMSDTRTLINYAPGHHRSGSPSVRDWSHLAGQRKAIFCLHRHPCWVCRT